MVVLAAAVVVVEVIVARLPMDVSLGCDPSVAVSVVPLSVTFTAVRFSISNTVSFISVRLYVCVSSAAVVVGTVGDVSLLAAVATLSVVVSFGNTVAL